MRKIATLGQFIGIIFIILSFISLNKFNESNIETISDVTFLDKWNETSMYEDDDELKEEVSWYANIQYNGKIYEKVSLPSEHTNENDNFYIYKNQLYGSITNVKMKNSKFIPLIVSGWFLLIVFSILKGIKK